MGATWLFDPSTADIILAPIGRNMNEAEALPPPSLPALRQELRIEPGAALVTGAPSWTLFDPVRHMFFQLGRIEFAILSRWASGDIAKINDDLRAQGMDPEDVDAAFGRVVEFSLSNSLTVTPMGDSVATFSQQRVNAKKAAWKWMLDNYLFFRLPLVKPAAFLERTLPRVAPLWSFPALVFFALLAVTGLFLVARQWDSFLASFMYFFNWQGVIAYSAGLFVVKILHELGHAYTATRFGCRVPTMGISFMVMMPVLYTDTTGAWRLTSRKQRMMIDCAGVTAELMMASVATLAWVVLPDGMLRSVMFILATTSWVLSLVINLNPFMRYDGYYVLSDLLGVPNLQPRAFALGRWRLRELLFDLGDPAPEQVPDKLRRIMIVYAWLTCWYRLVLFVGIAFLVYHMFFQPLGFILFCVEIGVFVARPIATELSAWVSIKDRIMQTRRGRYWPWIIGIGLVLCILPLDRHISAPAVLTPVGASPIIAGDPALVEKIFVRGGDRVKAGAALIQLSAPELELSAAATKVRIAELQLQYDRAASDIKDLSNRQVIERELARERDTLAGLERRADRLILRAPTAGVIADLKPDIHPGRWLGGAEVIAYVLTAGDYDIQAYIAEDDIWRIEDGALGRFIPADTVQASWAAKLVERSASALQTLDQPILASTNGGPIAVDKDDKDLRPRNALYRVRLIAAKQTQGDNAAIQITPGTIEITATGQSVASWLLGDLMRTIRKLF
jgi:putative peptide zinc metalloprotease protein